MANFSQLAEKTSFNRRTSLLQARRERPRRRTAQQRDDLAAFHSIELHSLVRRSHGPIAGYRILARIGQGLAAVRHFGPANDRLGSWLCKNAMVRRADRMDHPSACEFRRKDSCAQSNLIYLKKTILLAFAFPGFSHSLGS
jgi:hypothetical protein